MRLKLTFLCPGSSDLNQNFRRHDYGLCDRRSTPFPTYIGDRARYLRKSDSSPIKSERDIHLQTLCRSRTDCQCPTHATRTAAATRHTFFVQNSLLALFPAMPQLSFSSSRSLTATPSITDSSIVSVHDMPFARRHVTRKKHTRLLQTGNIRYTHHPPCVAAPRRKRRHWTLRSKQSSVHLLSEVNGRI